MGNFNLFYMKVIKNFIIYIPTYMYVSNYLKSIFEIPLLYYLKAVFSK